MLVVRVGLEEQEGDGCVGWEQAWAGREGVRRVLQLPPPAAQHPGAGGGHRAPVPRSCAPLQDACP